MSLESKILFLYNSKRKKFTTEYVSFEPSWIFTKAIPLCSLSIVADEKNTYFNQGNGDELKGQNLDFDHPLRHFMLSGHKDGKVLVWHLGICIGILDDFGTEVSAMSMCYDGVAFATTSGQIFLWDTNLTKCFKVIKLTELPFKILSTYIVSIDHNFNKLLVMTMSGDAVEVTLPD